MGIAARRRSVMRAFLIGLVAGGVCVYFALLAAAATGTIDPDGNGGQNDGVPNTCGGLGNYDCLDDGIGTSTTPAAGDFLRQSANNIDFFTMTSLGGVATATEIRIPVYHIEGGTNMTLDVTLYDATESVIYGAGTINLPNRTVAQWDTATFSGLSLSQAQLDGLRVRLQCTKGPGQGSQCDSYAMFGDVVFTQVVDVEVSSVGSQRNLDIGTTSAHVGGAFVISEETGSRNITSITITETGSVDAQTDLRNIKLFYEQAADCSVETYNGTEAQFGATATDGFSGPNGTSTFSDSVAVSTTNDMCVYVVLDVGTGATPAETLEVEISDPSTDVEGTGSPTVQPATPIQIAGTTILEQSLLEQVHYHWRNDDGSEATSTSATGGSEDTTYDAFPRATTKRLRLEVSNSGNKDTAASSNLLDPFTTGNTKTVSDGTNRLLVVAIHSEDSGTNVDVATVHYGGVEMTEVSDLQVGSGFANGLWVGYLDEAGLAAATNTSITPTWNGGVPDEAILYNSVVFEHVDQTEPVPEWSGNTNTSASTIQPTTTIAVADGDFATYFTSVGAPGQNHTPAAGYTEGTEEDSGGSGIVAASAFKAITAGGSEQPTADWSLTQNRLLIAALDIQFGHNYRLEYATKVTTCTAVSDGDWTDVGAAADAWDMAASQLVDGADTTNIAVSSGGVTDENSSFRSPNGGQRETTSETGPVPLLATEFVELEYSLQATASVVDGTTYCFRLTNQETPLDTYTVYPEATIVADVTVSATSSPPATVGIPSTDNYGGGFVITDGTAGAHTIDSFTITASGTADLQNGIDNITLRYESDTTAPLDCTGESYDGTETIYGAVDTDGMSQAGTSTFTEGTPPSVENGVNALCFYVEYDVTASSTDGETIEFRIANAATDVVVDSGSVSPAALVDVTGHTTFATPIVALEHYHWRDDLGTETTANSLTGAEDTPLTDRAKESTIRLRLGISNTGATTTTAYQYRLEWAQRVTSCSVATGWTDIDTAGDDWAMVASQLVHDTDTTDIGVPDGGVSNVGSFLGTNGGQQETDGTTGNLTLDAGQFVELEYSIEATTNAQSGSAYCFRVSNAGTALDTYHTYGEVSLKFPTDYKLQRGTTTIAAGQTTATIAAGVEYEAPSTTQSAFIRILNSGMTGRGPQAGTTGNHNAADVTAYISNPGNLTTSVTFQRAGTTGDTLIMWEIVEYIGAAGGENEMIVRDQGVVTYGTAATTVTTGTVNGVADDTDMVPFITAQNNPDTGRFDYNTGLSTSAWNAGTDTATFTRGEAGADAGNVSYAAVEFTGSNWAIQRAEMNYDASYVAGTATTSPITALGSLSRAFIHTQHAAGLDEDQHGDFGHEVWLSSIGAVSFRLNGAAQTPTLHTSVAWIIENTQTLGDKLEVTRSNGSINGGGGGLTSINLNIGKTVDDLSVTGLFFNSSNGGANRTFPEPILSVQLLSDTQYNIQVTDNADSNLYRTEVVEWPTATRKLTQDDFRFYVDNDTLTPTDPWPAGAVDLGENTAMTNLDEPLGLGEAVRLRMNLQVTAAAMPAGVDAFELEFAENPGSCTAVTSWHVVGTQASTTAPWRGKAATPADGDTLPSTLLSASTITGTYEEDTPTALTPNQASVGDLIEFDWNLEQNGAKEKTDYCFRMVESDRSPLEGYATYPIVRTAGYGPEIGGWRFYDDETSLTPGSPLAAENVSPSGLEYDNIVKLRVVLAEKQGATATNTKFALQYSEASDFTAGVHNVVASSTCAASATTSAQLWCYDDGAGSDNDLIDTALISDADSCAAGLGNGCGTRNEATTTFSTFDHTAYTNAEFEFTLRHDGARAGAVYYFRLYDLKNGVPVAASSTYPSISAQSAALTFSISGLPPGTTTESITTDATTTPNAIAFGSIPLDTEFEAAHRLSVDTNATEGYQVLVYSTQELLNGFGTTIAPVTASNSAPTGWGSACGAGADGCFGYHTADGVLDNGSTRFFADDSYAAFETDAREVMYSSVPTSERHDMVYKLQVGTLQQAGVYESEIVYIAIPTF